MRAKHLLFVFLLSLVSCRQLNQADYLTEVIDVDGIERIYHVRLPPNFDRDEPAPLVVALHGGGGEG